MKNALKKAVALLSALIILVTAVPVTYAASYGGSYNNCDIVRGTVSHYSGSGKLSYYYSDGYFRDDATEYNSHLATLSQVAAMSGMKRNNPYAAGFLSNIGCDNVSCDFPLLTSDDVGLCCGNKLLYSGESDQCVLIPAVICCSGSDTEWVTASLVGLSGDASGIKAFAESVSASVENYISGLDLGSAKIKIWLSGYSMGGAVCDIAAKLLSDKYGKDCVYAYACEALAAGGASVSGTYPNIHIVSNYNDILSLVIPEYMGFHYYGTVHTIAKETDNADFAAEEAAMLAQLKTFSTLGDSYKSPTDFTWAKIYIDVEKLVDIIGGSSDIYSEIDTSHKYGNSQRECVETIISRVSQRALKQRSSYSTDIPDDVKAAAARVGSNPYTVEECVGASVALISTFDSETLEKLEENTKNFPILKNIGLIRALYKFMTEFEYTSSRDTYAELFEDCWDALDTSSYFSGYEKISNILSEEQIAECKKILPISLYTLAGFISVDYSQDNQTMGSLLYNADAFGQAMDPALNLAWLRTEDSFYDGETESPLNVSADTMREIKIYSETDFEGITITVKDSSDNTVTAVSGGLTDENKAALSGICDVRAGTKYISFAFNKSSGYKLSISGGTYKTELDFYTRLYSEDKYNLTETLFASDGKEEVTISETGITVTGGTAKRILGDIDGDNKINAVDSNIMVQIILGKLQNPDKYFTAADLNGDGKVNAGDSIIIITIILGKS